MEKKYFKILERVFIAIAVISLFNIAIGLTLQFFTDRPYPFSNTEIGTYVFGYNGLLSIANYFFIPLSLLVNAFARWSEPNSVIVFLFISVSIMPSILFLLAHFHSKLSVSKYAFRFRVLAIVVMGFNIIISLLSVLFVKVKLLYMVDPPPYSGGHNFGLFPNIMLVIKVVFLAACYYYIKELTSRHINRKMEIDTDLNDTVFADIEKTEMVLVPASRLKRFFNYVIDLFFILTLFNSVNFLLLGNEDNEFISRSFRNFNIYYSLIAILGYYLVMESMFSLTIGKAITGCFVVGDNAEPIGFNKAIGRSLCRIIPFEPISMLGQSAWHDSITKTYVVDTEGAESINDSD